LDPNAGIFTRALLPLRLRSTEAITNFIEKKEEEKGDGQS